MGMSEWNWEDNLVAKNTHITKHMRGKQKASKDIQILFPKCESDFRVLHNMFFHLKQNGVPHRIISLIFLKLSIAWEK